MTSKQASSSCSSFAWRIVLKGEVQGTGIRPQIARFATDQGWQGSVRNIAEGVEVIVEAFSTSDGMECAQKISRMLGLKIDATVECVATVPHASFAIKPSQADGRLAVAVPRDIATCAACWSEVSSAHDRRFGYPLSACVECGPRFSVIKAMPYDRTRTTLDVFSLCEECESEYTSPQDRRFHAQAIACPRCGPGMWCVDQSGRRLAQGEEAIRLAIAAIRSSQIVALRGVGGYQLLCDASSASAVRNLRRKKQRPLKPFAVLCQDANTAEVIAFIDDLERSTLLSASNPIVLVRRRCNEALAREVCLDSDNVGVLLPTTPLHRMLARATDRPLVCTSGNRDGEPLVYRVNDAEQKLAGIADIFLHHNREIAQPIDDSVVRIIAGTVVTIRSARGLAPLQLPIDSAENLLAVGGYLKCAIAVANGSQSALGPHLGDLDSESTRERWTQQIASITDLYRVKDPKWICDAHPNYFTSRCAAERQFQPRRVWHHHAHIAAGQVEHNLLDKCVIGVAFDGTGLGPDGTIWGGEFLLVDGNRFRRIAHLRSFALIGGEMAIHEIHRLAVAVLHQLESISLGEISELLSIPLNRLKRWTQIADQPSTPRTTSCGRLFDAVAAITMGIGDSGFEGYAASCVESVFDESTPGLYDFCISDRSPRELDWRPVFEAIVRDLRRGANPDSVSAKFHRGLAAALIEVCRRLPQIPVVLSGGVFQNRRLVEEIVASWPHDRPLPVWPSRIPLNDGGLAAGQLAVAAMTSEAKG